MLSKTQATNYLSLAGSVVVILGYFNIKIDVNDLAMLMGALATIVGILLNFYHRYKKGDVNMVGIRTTQQTVDNTSSELG